MQHILIIHVLIVYPLTFVLVIVVNLTNIQDSKEQVDTCMSSLTSLQELVIYQCKMSLKNINFQFSLKLRRAVTRFISTIEKTMQLLYYILYTIYMYSQVDLNQIKSFKE